MPEPIYLALQVKDCAALCQFFAWIEREVLKGLRVGFFLMSFFYFSVVFSGRGKIVKTEMLGLISTLFEPFSELFDLHKQCHEKLASTEHYSNASLNQAHLT